MTGNDITFYIMIIMMIYHIAPNLCGLKFRDSCHFALKLNSIIQQQLIHENYKIFRPWKFGAIW